MKPIKIVLADDHPVYRDGLRQILEKEPEFQLVHEAGDGRDALDHARRLRADVVLLDLDMPRMSGLDAARERLAKGDPFEVVLLTMHREEDLFNEAMNLDVKGYVLKDSAGEEIRDAVRCVSDGRPYISPTLSAHLLKRARGAQALAAELPGLDKLTASERRILKRIASDRTSKEIADELGLSPRTIENHRTNICSKLGLRGSHALVKFAFDNRSKL